MRQIWSSMGLNAHWLLGKDEIYLLKGKTITGRVLFAVLLKFYQRYASFPEDISHIGVLSETPPKVPVASDYGVSYKPSLLMGCSRCY